ncbi:MAG: EsaB/YukD family protein [Alphaproteobacteria bacterium]|nr:EsaB/YukD family protein [Alphaproteobacteria bacterium]
MEPQAQAQTCQLRVQVVDVRAQTLDLILPTYLPARDLTQRVARDAGLDAFWPDGRRRLYWLRARGRLMADDERLMDLGVVPHELIHLLPEPPPGSGVVEQPPDFPENRGYAGKGTLALLGALVMVIAWSAGWGVSLMGQRTTLSVMMPGLGLGLLTCSVARHMFGGEGGRPRVAGVGLILVLLLVVLAFLPPVVAGEDPRQVYYEAVPGLITAMAGVLMAWLAWWGAVEPLPEKREQPVEQETAAIAMVPCGICGQDAAPDVRMECPYTCGKHFHTGCYSAHTAVNKGDGTACVVCGARVA